LDIAQYWVVYTSIGNVYWAVFLFFHMQYQF